MLKSQRDQMKPDLIWNIEKGLALTPEAVAKAELRRSVCSAMWSRSSGHTTC